METSQNLFLVVDDEPLFVRSIVDAIGAARQELRVIGVNNGSEALAVIEREEVSILFTDLRMPIMNGYQLLAQLISQNFRAPIIVATAFGTPNLERRLGALSGVHYLEKPIDLDVFLALLDHLLRTEAEATDRGLGAFLQLLSMDRKTARLRLQSGPQNGYLDFLDGRLVDARAGDLRGDAAAAEILRWRSLALELKEGMVPGARTVETPMQDLLSGSWPLPSAKTANDKPAPVLPKERVRRSIESAMKIDGALGAAIVDYESGLTLGSRGAVDVEQAACGNTELVRAEIEVIRALKLEDTVEDILITLGQQCHLIRPLTVAPSIFLYLIIDRAEGNLGMAHRQLSAIEKELSR